MCKNAHGVALDAENFGWGYQQAALRLAQEKLPKT
jgi:hypothetical protein